MDKPEKLHTSHVEAEVDREPYGHHRSRIWITLGDLYDGGLTEDLDLDEAHRLRDWLTRAIEWIEERGDA